MALRHMYHRVMSLSMNLIDRRLGKEFLGSVHSLVFFKIKYLRHFDLVGELLINWMKP